jgi:small subunit ribosomal protein S6
LRKYELLFITHPDYDDEKVAAVMQRYQDVITRGQGVVKTSEKWGKRRLAYELDGLREGLYILMTFDADGDVSAELDRLMKIDQDVVRHMISRMDQPRHKINPRKPREPHTDEPRVESAETGLPVKVVREAPAGSASEAETVSVSRAPKTGETTQP